MGSALGARWREGGNEVVVYVEDRSERTKNLARRSGLRLVASPLDVVASDVVISIVPPGSASVVARDIATVAERAGTSPLVADLNAIAPSTVQEIEKHLATAGLDLVDGSISGLPPTKGPATTRLYLSGERSAELADLNGPGINTTRVGDRVGAASALKMCTASMYKGTNALVMQAMLAAARHDVLEHFLADVVRMWPEQVLNWPREVALAATKADRFVDEMREIARTQADAGLVAAMFEGIAAVFERAAHTELGLASPESIDRDVVVDDVLRRLQ